MASSCIFLSPFVTITLCSVAEHLISEVVHGFKFSHRAIVAYDRCSFNVCVCVRVCVLCNINKCPYNLYVFMYYCVFQLIPLGEILADMRAMSI